MNGDHAAIAQADIHEEAFVSGDQAATQKRLGDPHASHATSCVGSRRALLGANHRGKVWKPFQGFHISVLNS